MDTNGRERKTQNHEWTRMGTKGWEGTTKHTKYTKGKFRATSGHEWREGEIQNHEWTRMDTNGTTKYRSGTTKHTKYTKKGRGDSMNHERHERIV